MAINWGTFYPSATNPTLGPLPAQDLIDLMIATADIHADEFPPGMNVIVANKVTAGDYMRVRVGRDNVTNRLLAVIFYHRLQHFPHHNRWSVSVGVHADLMPRAPLGTTTLPPHADYVALAAEISTQMHTDATTVANLPIWPTRPPSSTELIVYDHVHLASASGIAPASDRVRKRIGYLGWAAQQTLNTTLWQPATPSRVPRPREKGLGTRPEIKGWGRDSSVLHPTPDTHVIMTILRPR